MASPSCPARRHEANKSLLALSDDLLEDIFLLLGSPADLIRASTACVALRRLIADPTFLRRYRSLHPPLLLGTLCLSYRSLVFYFQAVREPHPSAPHGGALAIAADFSFSYLAPHHRWHRWDPCDVGDGRVLMCGPAVYAGGFPDLAVCGPLSRQYLLLPAIPDGLLASVQVQKLIDFEASFIPSRDMDETLFKVICRAHSVTKLLLVLVFSSASGRWSIGTCTGWDSLSLNATSKDTLLSSPQCQWAYGCCYWKVYMENKLLKLDTERMEFSTVDLPPDHDGQHCVIVEAEEGKIGMFSHSSGATLVDYYTFFQNDSEKAHLKNSIPLPVGYQWNIQSAVAEGYIFLVGRGTKKQGLNYSPVFSLEIKTFTLERFGKVRYPYRSIYPYFGFPPSMSPRRVQGDEALQG